MGIAATDENRKAAEAFLAYKVDRVKEEKNSDRPFIGPQQQRITVSKLLDALEADYKLRGKDSPQFKAHLKPVREHFGDWRALDVPAESVDKFIAKRLEGDGEGQGKAPATVNRSTQLLGQAFALAVERRHLSSAPQIRHLSERGNARQGFFGDWEFRAVVDNRITCLTNLKDFARFGYLTGRRRRETASLRWEDVDCDLIRLRGENAKNGEACSITGPL